MIKIYEEQHEKGNRDNNQNRVISYSSFDTYVQDLLNDKSENLYPSLPRQTKIIKHAIKGNAVTLEFHHRLMNCIMTHTAIVVNN